jgi:hypothetical protein
MNKNEASFEGWMSLKNLPKNISYQNWFDIRDWVEMREGIKDSITLYQFKMKRSNKDTLKSPEKWLSEAKWENLDSRYSHFLKEDSLALANGYSTGISQEDWGYYNGTINKLGEDKEDLKLRAAIDEMTSIKQKSALEKYIDVFTKIGGVLIFISLLIALVSKPIKRLMHGVE